MYPLQPLEELKTVMEYHLDYLSLTDPIILKNGEIVIIWVCKNKQISFVYRRQAKFSICSPYGTRDFPRIYFK